MSFIRTVQLPSGSLLQPCSLDQEGGTRTGQQNRLRGNKKGLEERRPTLWLSPIVMEVKKHHRGFKTGSSERTEPDQKHTREETRRRGA